VRAPIAPQDTKSAKGGILIDVLFGCRECSSHTCGILWADGIQKLAASRQAHFGDVKQKRPRNPQASVDMEGPVQIWVVNETFPANGRARFLKVDSHDNVEVCFRSFRVRTEGVSVVNGGAGVVHRTGSEVFRSNMQL
jgi:hypothetical protein